jgi:succinate dehydrogenase / fumarate reductase cytochrome b subunit
VQNAAKKERPVYLSLTQFAWPIMAIASIIHRITGVILFVGIGYLLWLLSLALSSPEGFADARAFLALPLPKLALIGVLGLLTYHLVAGIKHMIMDFHIGDTLEAGPSAAYAVFAISIVLTGLLGIWLW